MKNVKDKMLNRNSSLSNANNKKIEIANIVLDGRFGGPQNRILQVAEKLKKYNIETIVVIPKNNSETFYSKLIEKSISLKRLNLHRLTRHKSHLIGEGFFFIPEIISLYRLLRKNDIQLVHCNSSFQIKGILAGKMAGAKVVWHLNDTELPGILKIIFNMVGKLCDGFIVAGKSVYNFYLDGNRFQKKKVIEIQAPVDTSYLNPESIPDSELIRTGKEIKIITMGTINPTKRIEDFIEVANFLNKKYQNLSFYIVGPHLDSQKKYSEKLKQLTNYYKLKNIFFMGRYNNIPSLLKDADIYVCASETEASPMAVWEAMAMEKAIVSTDVGDVKLYIKDGENGFIVSPGDVKVLAEKIGLLIEDEKMRSDFGKRARTIAVQKLDLEICAKKHRDFYLEVLGLEHTGLGNKN